MQFRKIVITMLASLALVVGMAGAMSATANASPATYATQVTQMTQTFPDGRIAPQRWLCNWGWHNGYFAWDWRDDWYRGRIWDWWWHPWWGYGCQPYWRR
jgi:hypothetical protein